MKYVASVAAADVDVVAVLIIKVDDERSHQSVSHNCWSYSSAVHHHVTRAINCCSTKLNQLTYFVVAFYYKSKDICVCIPKDGSFCCCCCCRWWRWWCRLRRMRPSVKKLETAAAAEEEEEDEELFMCVYFFCFDYVMQRYIYIERKGTVKSLSRAGNRQNSAWWWSVGRSVDRWLLNPRFSWENPWLLLLLLCSDASPWSTKKQKWKDTNLSSSSSWRRRRTRYFFPVISRLADSHLWNWVPSPPSPSPPSLLPPLDDDDDGTFDHVLFPSRAFLLLLQQQLFVWLIGRDDTANHRLKRRDANLFSTATRHISRRSQLRWQTLVICRVLRVIRFVAKHNTPQVSVTAAAATTTITTPTFYIQYTSRSVVWLQRVERNLWWLSTDSSSSSSALRRRRCRPLLHSSSLVCTLLFLGIWNGTSESAHRCRSRSKNRNKKGWSRPQRELNSRCLLLLLLLSIIIILFFAFLHKFL